jgi:hypothetical protein
MTVSTHSIPSFPTSKTVALFLQCIDEKPHIQLYEGLKFVVFHSDWLPHAINEATKLIKLVDQAPRHDTYLVDEKWSATVTGIMSGDKWILERAQKELQLSIESIAAAYKAIYGQFRGETKVKTEDALARHLAESQRLLANFAELEVTPQGPYQPYQIRQKCLSKLLLEIGAVLDLLTPLRRGLNAEQFPDGLFTQLVEQEAALFRLRAKLSKWRDNPSQKLQAKLEVCREQAIAINERLSQIKALARAECKRQGIKFYTRAGEVP